MSIIDLSVRMKSAAAMSIGAAARLDGELTIRIRPLTPDLAPDLDSHGWAWAIVLETKGDSQPDALIIGGVSPTQSGALAMADAEYKRQAAIRAQKRKG